MQETPRDAGLIPGLGRSPGVGMTTRSSIFTWKIPWTEEPRGLWGPWGHGELAMTEHTLLYSTGASIQYPVITYMGKESEKEELHVYV